MLKAPLGHIWQDSWKIFEAINDVTVEGIVPEIDEIMNLYENFNVDMKLRIHSYHGIELDYIMKKVNMSNRFSRLFYAVL